MAKKDKGKKKKSGWLWGIGLFCIFGAVVMATTAIAAAFFYAMAAIVCFSCIVIKKKLAQGKTEPLEICQNEDPKDNTLATPVQKDEPALDYEEKTYRVTGVEHYLDNLLGIAVCNSDYDLTKKDIIDFGMTDQYIWEHNFFPSKLELQPEPDNPYDPNAIQVLIDDKLVGYIKKGSCRHLLNVMDQDRFMGATCKIGGGKYKRVDEEYDYDRDKTTYSMDKGERTFSIVLTIKERKKQ